MLKHQNNIIVRYYIQISKYTLHYVTYTYLLQSSESTLYSTHTYLSEHSLQ